jgi:hypothetical protein
MQAQLKDIIPTIEIDPKPNVVVLTKGESMALGNGKALKNLMCGLVFDFACSLLPTFLLC